MDCSWGFGNNGCDGGEEFRSFQYMLKHGGLASEEDYGHYLGVVSLNSLQKVLIFFNSFLIFDLICTFIMSARHLHHIGKIYQNRAKSAEIIDTKNLIHFY